MQRVPLHGVSLSKLLNFTLKIVQEINFEVRDASIALFFKSAGSDKVVSFQEFKSACADMKPESTPTEGSYSFMYWRAAQMHENPSAKEVHDAVYKWEDAFKEIGGKKASVEVDVAVESFMWHCGIFNVLGKQADGRSALEEHRQRSKLVKSIKAVVMG
jgi:hypothetical protein